MNYSHHSIFTRKKAKRRRHSQRNEQTEKTGEMADKQYTYILDGAAKDYED